MLFITNDQNSIISSHRHHPNKKHSDKSTQTIYWFHMSPECHRPAIWISIPLSLRAPQAENIGKNNTAIKVEQRRGPYNREGCSLLRSQIVHIYRHSHTHIQCCSSPSSRPWLTRKSLSRYVPSPTFSRPSSQLFIYTNSPQQAWASHPVDARFYMHISHS